MKRFRSGCWLALAAAVALGCSSGNESNEVAIVIADPSPKAPVAAPTPDNATATPVPTDSTKTVAAPADAKAAPAPASDPGAFGTIKGKIVFAGDPPALPVLVKQGDQSVKDASVCAVKNLLDRSLLVDPATKGVANCYAYLVNPKGANPGRVAELKSQAAEVVIDQVNCEYVPFSSAMMVGQPVLIKSSDPVNHNVRYATQNTSKNPPGNTSLPGNGSFRPTLGAAERNPTDLKCDIHPWMKGSFMVLDHPYFAVSTADGTFEIKGVPPGTQNLIVRLPTGTAFLNADRAKGQAVEVKAGETVEVSFEAKP